MSIKLVRDLRFNKLPDKLRRIYSLDKLMLSEEIKSSFKDAATKLTGFKKRSFIAKVTKDYFDSSARKAETVMGWSRDAIKTGLKEMETGIVCLNYYSGRGRKKTEDHLIHLREDIENLLENNVSTDPQFRTTLRYTRISALKIREALISEKGYSTQQLPCRQTIGDILNRMGYSLKKHKK